MTKRVSHPSSVTALLLFLAVFSQSESQAFIGQKSKEGESQVIGQGIRKIVKKTGWGLPASPETLGTSKTWTMFWGSDTVLKKQLQLSSEPLYTLERFILEDGVLTVSSQLCVVREIYALQVARKTFAYEAVLVEVVLLDGGIRQYIGRVYRVFYSDEDGDGIFETRHTLQPRIVPDWAKDK